MTTTTHLHTVIAHWDDLTTALGTPNTTSWPPSGLRNYMAALTAREQMEAAWARREERNDSNPNALGECPIPISVSVFDTMRAVETALVHLADHTAAAIQRPTMSHAPHNWPHPDRIRRNQLADADAADPRRWRYHGTRSAPYAAAWLLARLEGQDGPFGHLTFEQHARIVKVARGAAERVEQALDIARQARPIDRPCPACRQPRLVVEGGDGEAPAVRCLGCGRTWTAQADAVA